MARTPKPWYRKDRKSWFVTINGKRHNLGEDKDEALQAFYQLMAGPDQIDKISVFALMDEFLDWTQKHRAPRTYEFYQERINRFVADNANMDCLDLKPFHVQKWLDGKTWGATYKAGFVASIKRCFNGAIRQGYLSTNPIQFLEKPKPNKRETPVTREEHKTLLANIRKKDPFYDLVVFSWETGCRSMRSRRSCQICRSRSPKQFTASNFWWTILDLKTVLKPEERWPSLTDATREAIVVSLTKSNCHRAPKLCCFVGHP